jgi:hypothetical protein
MADNETTQPMLRVVSGDPTPEELAIVIALVTARGGESKPSESKRLSLWASKGRQTRPSVGAGFGSWRASSMPR